MLKNSLKIALSIFLLTSIINAKENSNSSSDIPNSDTPKGWWYKSSYDYPSNDRWLTRFTGKIGYKKTEGNTEENYLKINLGATVRKNNLTYFLTYEKKDKEKLNYPDKYSTPISIKTDVYTISNTLAYDLNKYFVVFGGHENARDISMEVYNKNTYFVVGGLRAINSKSHRVNLFLGYGNEDISFGSMPLLPSGATDIVYSEVTYRWLINKGTTFKTSYRYFKSKIDYRDSSKFNVSLNMAVTKNVSIVLNYEDEYLEAIEVVDAFTHDKTFVTQLKFSY